MSNSQPTSQPADSSKWNTSSYWILLLSIELIDILCPFGILEREREAVCKTFPISLFPDTYFLEILALTLPPTVPCPCLHNTLYNIIDRHLRYLHKPHLITIHSIYFLHKATNIFRSESSPWRMPQVNVTTQFTNASPRTSQFLGRRTLQH